MCTSISEAVVDDNLDFSMWDSFSFSDPSLPFGDILFADRVREWFADSDALFGSGENNVWNTGLTLGSFLGQVLGDGKASPQMVERELWTTLLAYNLVRWVCAQAARVHDKLPR